MGEFRGATHVPATSEDEEYTSYNIHVTMHALARSEAGPIKFNRQTNQSEDAVDTGSASGKTALSLPN